MKANKKKEEVAIPKEEEAAQRATNRDCSWGRTPVPAMSSHRTPSIWVES